MIDTKLNTYYLYRHIRLDTNEVFYIGISKERARAKCHTNLYKRAYTKDSRNKYWHNIISKTAYEVEILFESKSKEYIVEKEIELILLYGRKDLKTGSLVNMTCGGEGAKEKKVSQETIDKIRKAVIHFKTGEEFKCLEEACKKYDIKYLSERERILAKKETSTFYYKESPFDNNGISKIEKNIVVEFDTKIEYSTIEEACKKIGVRVDIEKDRIWRRSPIANFYYKHKPFIRIKSDPKKVKAVVFLETGEEFNSHKQGCNIKNISKHIDSYELKANTGKSKFKYIE